MRKDIERLLAKADIWRLLSLSFVYPGRENIENLGLIVSDMEGVIPGLAFDIQREFLLYKDSLKGLCTEEIEWEFTDLFMTRMLCSPYETAYGNNGLNKAMTLADLNGFYNAFGLSIPEGEGDRPDHIAVEMEFLSLLSIKEAYGIEQELKDMVDVIASAKKGFLKDHLCKWATTFCGNLRERTTKDFYRNLALLTSRFVKAEAGFYGLELKPEEELQRESPTPINCHAEGCGEGDICN